VDPDLYNEALGGLLPSRFTEVKTRGGGTFERSPLGLALPPLDRDEFRVFRSGGASVFSQVRFGKVLGTEPRLEPDSGVVLRFTDGLPALLERKVGKGRVMLFTSTVDDDWTDLPLRSIFVSLVHQVARGLSGTLLMDSGGVYEVGESVMLSVPAGPSAGAWVVRPDGREVRLDLGAADPGGRVPFRETAIPGHYSLLWKNGDPGGDGVLRSIFSVRVPGAESRLGKVTAGMLHAELPGLVFHGAGGGQGDDEPGEVLRTASLLPLLLVLLAMVLASEAILGGRRP
jgi:hypothetical protein